MSRVAAAAVVVPFHFVSWVLGFLLADSAVVRAGEPVVIGNRWAAYDARGLLEPWNSWPDAPDRDSDGPSICCFPPATVFPVAILSRLYADVDSSRRKVETLDEYKRAAGVRLSARPAA